MKKTILEVSEETYKKIESLLKEDEKINTDYDNLIGTCLFIRTVTYHQVGKVERITGQFLELSGASWVADSGRFMNAIKDGTLEEVEPVGKMYVSLDSIVDMVPWIHKLPTEQK